MSQTITLETNDPHQPRVVIRIKGEVRQVYQAAPADRVTFGRIERDATATHSIELRNNTDQKVFLKLKSVSNQRKGNLKSQISNAEPPFEVKLEEIESGMAYKLSATTRPPLKLGANAAEVVLETGVEKFPTLTYPVSAYITPRVAVTPSRLWVSPRVTNPFQRIVRVTYRPDQPVEIKIS